MPTRIMLDDLKNIEWGNFQHAYGAAIDVPFLIEGLLSEESIIYEESINELFGNIWHQGTIYEATPKAIPFLIYIFENNQIKNKNSLLVLLACIASGNGYHQIHSKKISKNDLTNFTAELEKEVLIVSEVRNLCEPLIKTFISELNNDESSVRETVAVALSKYPNFKDESLIALNEALKKETCEDVKNYIKESIAALKNA